ncbi:MAG: hypothetical protein M1815_006265 [Lichina confinis]|nr:MAG: hypothetical protein M1815_006265 [Lichina confinis]
MSISAALVTGGAGFVGAAIVQSLNARHPECRITVLDIRLPPQQDRIPDVAYYRADVTSAEETSEALDQIRPQVVIHTAGVVPPLSARYSRVDDARVFAINVEGTRNVLAASRAVGVVAFVLTSSCTVVTDALDFELRNVDERLPRFTRSLSYGESKAEAERIVLEGSDEFLPACAIRPSVIFGLGDPNCLPTMYACIARRETPFIIGSGDNLYDFTFIDNVADAHILAAENLLSSGTAVGEAFFITNGEPVFFRDFCLAVWAEFGHLPAFEVRIPECVAWAAGFALEWVSWLTGKPIGLCRGSVYDALRTRYLNIDKARKMLGYTPRVGLAEGVHLACQAYRKELEQMAALNQPKAKTALPSSFLRGLLARASALVGHRDHLS